MSAATAKAWLDANQRYLMAEVARVRHALDRAGGLDTDHQPPAEPTLADFADGAPPALASLCAAFGLSPFERDILLLCAAAELDGGVASRCARASGDPGRPYPTFGLALAALEAPHWSALAPVAPLRRWRLVELVNAGAEPLVTARLRIDERVLHHLAGLDYLDERLAALIKPVVFAGEPAPAHTAIAGEIAARLRATRGPIAIQLCGDDRASKRPIAAAACTEIGGSPYELNANDIPANAYERETLARLWEREAALSAAVLLLETTGGAVTDRAVTEREATSRAAAFAAELGSPLIVLSREPLGLPEHASVRFDVIRPRWQNPQAVRDSNLRRGADGRMDELAQHIEPLATWNDLVLPGSQLDTLHEIAAHIRQMHVVYGDWGFAGKGTRGLGISALFSGASGTGKTMAAEVLANELALDLYRIDLERGGQQVHRRDREKPAPRVRHRGGNRRHPAVRRGGRAVRQAHRGEGQP